MTTFDEVLASGPALCYPREPDTRLGGEPDRAAAVPRRRGRLEDTNGSPVLDREPLLAVLSYYEQAAVHNIISGAVLNVTTAEECWSAFANAEATMIGVDAWTYLKHKALVPNTGLAPVPTLDGTPITAFEGWMWVLATPDPDRQNQARAFLSWMMRVGQHSLFTEAMGVLPTQQRALRLWDDTTYAAFVQGMILAAR